MFDSKKSWTQILVIAGFLGAGHARADLVQDQNVALSEQILKLNYQMNLLCSQDAEQFKFPIEAVYRPAIADHHIQSFDDVMSKALPVGIAFVVLGMSVEKSKIMIAGAGSYGSAIVGISAVMSARHHNLQERSQARAARSKAVDHFAKVWAERLAKWTKLSPADQSLVETRILIQHQLYTFDEDSDAKPIDLSQLLQDSLSPRQFQALQESLLVSYGQWRALPSVKTEKIATAQPAQIRDWAAQGLRTLLDQLDAAKDCASQATLQTTAEESRQLLDSVSN